MADTLRQKLIDAVIERLKLINGSGAYVTDINEKVFDWPRHAQGAGSDHELPYMGVFDVENQTSREHQRDKKADRQLTIQVRCYVKSNTPAAMCRKIIGDIETAIGVDETWGKLAATTMPSREGPDIKAENLEISAAVVEFTILYNTCAFNPYQ